MEGPRAHPRRPRARPSASVPPRQRRRGFDASADEVGVGAGDDATARAGSSAATAAAARCASKPASNSSAPSPSSPAIRSRSNRRPGALPLGRRYTPTAAMYTQWQPGVIAMVDFDGGAFHRGATITREHVQAVLRRVSGTDHRDGAAPRDHVDRSSSKRRPIASGASCWPAIAAHIHSPLGGQGLNLGPRRRDEPRLEARATVRGDAPDGLLDSYTAERRPIGARS